MAKKPTRKVLIAACEDMSKVMDLEPNLFDDGDAADLNVDQLIEAIQEGAGMAAENDKLKDKTWDLLEQMGIGPKVAGEEEETPDKDPEETETSDEDETEEEEPKETAAQKKKRVAKEKKAAEKEKKDKAKEKKTEKKGRSAGSLTTFIQEMLNDDMDEDAIVIKAKKKHPEKSYRVIALREHHLRKQSK